MSAVQTNAFGLWAEPARDAFNFWISFSPLAPLFGVEWRFSQDAARMTDGAQQVAGKMADDCQKAAEQMADAVEGIVETSLAEVEVAPFVEPIVDEPVLDLSIIEAPIAEAGAPANLMTEAPAGADDLTLMNGVGPALARQLNGLGIYTFAQIAEYGDAELAWVDERLTGIKGRCYRDNWVGQAKARV